MPVNSETGMIFFPPFIMIWIGGHDGKHYKWMHNQFLLTFLIFSALYWLELEDMHQPENVQLLTVFF